MSVGIGATVGSTTVGTSASTFGSSGPQWGQTTQIGLGGGIEICVLPRPSNEQCDASDQNGEDGPMPDNYTAGVGRHAGIRIGKDGTFCINFGPSVGLPFGAGWDL
jgi:hypothetical protein